MKIQIITADLEPSKNNDGKFNILISKVKVMDRNGKYIKFAKLNKDLLKVLKNKTIDI